MGRGTVVWNEIVAEFKPTEENFSVLIPKMIDRLWRLAYEQGLNDRDIIRQGAENREMQKTIDKLEKLVVGKEPDKARAALISAGYRMRVCIKDGKGCALTADFRRDRANVEISNGLVIRIVRMG